MDELGSALRHSDEPNFRVAPFLFMPEGNLASAVRFSFYLSRVCCFEAETIFVIKYIYLVIRLLMDWCMFYIHMNMAFDSSVLLILTPI